MAYDLYPCTEHRKLSVRWNLGGLSPGREPGDAILVDSMTIMIAPRPRVLCSEKKRQNTIIFRSWMPCYNYVLELIRRPIFTDTSNDLPSQYYTMVWVKRLTTCGCPPVSGSL